jgi:hypothetical protein
MHRASVDVHDPEDDLTAHIVETVNIVDSESAEKMAGRLIKRKCHMIAP